MYKLKPDESDEWENITGLDFAIKPCSDQTNLQPLSLNDHEWNY